MDPDDEELETCAACHGSGECPDCMGEGDEDCPCCYGSGECEDCEGHGEF